VGGIYKATRVVVYRGGGIAKRLEDRGRLEEELLNRRVLARLVRQVVDDELGGLGLSSTGLTTDEDAFVRTVRDDAAVGIVGDGKDVRRQRAKLCVRVLGNDLWAVQRHRFVRVDGDEDRARVSLTGSHRYYLV